ncbi:MAG: hypothetical protein RQ729_11315 [Wenzhouxiangellaceae bacterium]|nr:hypothetical protein [Wenzhouxiangellaceae bacterium]
MPHLSSRTLRALAPGQWRSEPVGGHGQGSLQARRLHHGIRWYYRAGARGIRLPLQARDDEVLSLTEARQRARQIAARTGPTRHDATTLGALLTTYCDRLAAEGRPSATATRALFERHVQQAAPALWLTPARRVGREAILALLHPLVERDQRPTAAKLRAGLHAAYEAAVRVSCDAHGQALMRFGVTANPVAGTAPIRSCRRSRTRVLEVAELQAYWRRLASVPGVVGITLRLHVLTGGQRIAQLLRVTRGDVHGDSLVLHDAKGRRATPRVHRIPLIAPARAEIARIGGHLPYLFSRNGGVDSITPATLRRHVAQIAHAMCRAGAARETFSLSDLRRSVETRLAALGVSRDIRAHLLSHDLGGIQDRHYDAYDYYSDMRDALSALHDLMNPPVTQADNVVALRLIPRR